MRRVVYTRVARRALDELVTELAHGDLAAALALLHRVQSATDTLANHPALGREVRVQGLARPVRA